MCPLIRDFPMGKAEKLAIFNSVGFVNDAAGFAGKGRVWGRVEKLFLVTDNPYSTGLR